VNRVIKALVASGVTAALVATMAACDPDSDSTSGSSEGSTTPTADPAASESVQPIYAYVAHNEIFVMDGDHQIGHVDGDDPFPSLAWSDDARYLAVLQGGVLTVLDVESGQTSELDCTSCGAMTIWGDRLVVSEPAAGAGFAYDLVTYALPDLSGRQLLRADFPRPVGYWWKVSVAGDDLVAFGAEENGGARSSLDIYLVHPDGSTARVGKREYAGPAGFAYAADSAYGGPRFAYVSQTSGGVCTGESRALLVDPAAPEGATETDATDVFHHPLISEAMDEFIDVWFGTDGMLYATAHTRSCEFSAGGYAKDLAPPGVWRLDGTQWVSVDDRPLLSERVFGPDERVEITMNPDAPGPNGELWGTLRWITADGATVLSRGASQISTPPYAADEPDAPVEEPDREELAERFAPMIWIAKGEELQPIDADRIIAESDLMFSNPGPGGCPDPIVSDESVDAQRLAAGGYVAYEQVNGCQDGKRWVTNEGPAPMDRDQAGFYLDIRDAAFGGDGNTAPVYVEFKDGQYLVYWFAYGDNNATLGPVKDFDHEGRLGADGRAAGRQQRADRHGLLDPRGAVQRPVAGGAEGWRAPDRLRGEGHPRDVPRGRSLPIRVRRPHQRRHPMGDLDRRRVRRRAAVVELHRSVGHGRPGQALDRAGRAEPGRQQPRSRARRPAVQGVRIRRPRGVLRALAIAGASRPAGVDDGLLRGADRLRRRVLRAGRAELLPGVGVPRRSHPEGRRRRQARAHRADPVRPARHVCRQGDDHPAPRRRRVGLYRYVGTHPQDLGPGGARATLTSRRPD